MSTPLTRIADIHLALRPGTDGALALGMANVIIQENLYDADFVGRWTTGFDEFRTYAAQFTPENTEAITGVDGRSDGSGGAPVCPDPTGCHDEQRQRHGAPYQWRPKSSRIDRLGGSDRQLRCAWRQLCGARDMVACRHRRTDQF